MRKLATLLCVLLAAVALPATAAAVGSDEAAAGLKVALQQGAGKAIALLGKQDGFFGNPDVHIPLPGVLQKGRKTLDKLGLKKQTAALDLAINRAAEAAVPQARQLFADAIGRMSLSDALGILKGPDDAATQYFRASMTAPLTEAFLPIVGRNTAQLDLAKKYSAVATKAADLGLVEQQDASLDAYVTRKALDGLFLVMAREEAAIRKDPLGQANALLKEVFGQ
ncbi:MAG: DUF4197 domain-containing protein [Pseudomonadota bacterium]